MVLEIQAFQKGRHKTNGHCNPTNNKSNCLFDDYDCLCPNSTLINDVYVDCTGRINQLSFDLSIVALLVIFAALPVPSKIKLVLDGDVLEEHSKRQGNFTLAEGLVNGFPYWIQQDGKNAIWSFWSSYWMVGHIDNLGKTIGFIAVQFDSKVWPTQILDGYLYSTSVWQSASINEVLFTDCKY